MVDTCHHTLVQTHTVNNTQSEPSCKLWTLGDNDTSVYVHPPSPVYHSGDNGEAVRVGAGQMAHEDSLCLTFNFAGKLKRL